jgi:hypothetical protein
MYVYKPLVVVVDDEKVKIVKANLVHSSDVVDDVQHIVLAQQVSLSLEVVVAFVMVIDVVDSSPVVVQMNELNLYVMVVK